jgi:glycerophosphoryl diester phosphodiesterase
MEHNSLVGHRGSPLEFPENSIPGLARCLDLDARFIEIDVQLTRDRQVVLHHDRNMDRSCGRDGAIHQYTLAELNRFSFSEPDFFKDRFNGLPPATLETAVALCRSRPGLTLFIEVKPVAVEQFGVEAVLASIDDAIGRPWRGEVLISYRTDLLETAAESGWSRTGWILHRWEESGSEQANRHEYLFCNVSRLPEAGPLVPCGPKLGVYDVVEPGLANRLLGRGVDLVETFDLPGMLEAQP